MRRFAIRLFYITCLLWLTKANAQQQETYTFCAGSSYCYLIDTAGNTSNYFARWNTGSTAYVAHFQKDTIYQSSGAGSGGGSYGSLKKWACSSTTAATCVWTYTASNLHHDFCPMPNGNVLVIVKETKTAAQITAAGGTYSGNTISEKIQEIHPTGATTGSVVWEWKLWDHLCQSTSSSYPHYYSNVAFAPQLMNINYNMSSDWWHMNGIDYNPVLDQIIVSSHFMNEVYIIDHSTTTAQAATHTGGNAGRGGDFLYRWGNPAAYNCAAGGNGVTLNAIHDVRWVSANNTEYPSYVSFFHNNGGTNAQVILFLPPYNGYNYTYTPGSIIGPTTCSIPTVPGGINSLSQGGAQALDNGNILMTYPGSKFYECSGTGTTYQNVSVATVQADRLKRCEVIGPFPIASASASTICVNTLVTLNSSATAPLQTSPSYSYSWSSIPSGFTSNSQSPTVTPIAAGTYTYIVTVSSGGCSNTASVNVVVDDCSGVVETKESNIELNIYPNPTTGLINLNEEFTLTNDFEIIVCNSIGEVIINAENTKTVDLSDCRNGVYYLTVITGGMNVINRKVVLIK